MAKSPHITPHDEVSNVVEAEALAWIAQLDGDDITAKDLKALQEWINRSPAHAKEIRDLSELWGELNHLTDMIGPIAEADYVSSQLRAKRKGNVWRYAAVIPLIAISVIGIVSISDQVRNNPDVMQSIETAAFNIPKVYKTQIGEHQKHTLPDGSVVTLNTGSRIEVDFRDDQRRVRLLQGEVLFDVEHDNSRPFLVFAGEGLVRAVGTAFVVRLNDGDVIDVMVTEGSVELSSVLPISSALVSDPPAAKISSLGVVKAGHSASFENLGASIAAVSEHEMTAKLSWRDGFLTFSGETLEEVILEVSRYTELDIEFESQALRELQFGGVLPAGDMDNLFLTLKSNFNIEAELTESGKVTLSRDQ